MLCYKKELPKKVCEDIKNWGLDQPGFVRFENCISGESDESYDEMADKIISYSEEIISSCIGLDVREVGLDYDEL